MCRVLKNFNIYSSPDSSHPTFTSYTSSTRIKIFPAITSALPPNKPVFLNYYYIFLFVSPSFERARENFWKMAFERWLVTFTSIHQLFTGYSHMCPYHYIPFNKFPELIGNQRIVTSLSLRATLPFWWMANFQMIRKERRCYIALAVWQGTTIEGPVRRWWRTFPGKVFSIVTPIIPYNIRYYTVRHRHNTTQQMEPKKKLASTQNKGK